MEQIGVGIVTAGVAYQYARRRAIDLGHAARVVRAVIRMAHELGRKVVAEGVESVLLLGMGETFVIITGGIDLAVGSILGLSAVVSGTQGLSVAPALLAFIAPLLFGTLVCGIAGSGSVKAMGRIGLKAIVYFEIVTTIATLPATSFTFRATL